MRTRMLAALAAVLLAGTGGVLLSGDAFGATQACTGTLPGTTVNTNVTVPSGSTCNIQGQTINGNVAVQPGGRLIIGGGSTVNGTVSSNSAGTDSTTNPFGPAESFSVVICNSTVTGTVTILNSASQVLVGGTSTGGGGCGGNTLGNNVNLSNNLGVVTLSGNSGACSSPSGTCGITGNVLVSGNTGPVTVTQNAIGGNLACSSNGTITSSGNTFKSHSGQCTA